MADKDKTIAFKIEVDSKPRDDLKFWSIVGHEALSRPSFYELTILCKESSINPDDILGKPFTVFTHFEDADRKVHDRYFNGHAVRLIRGDKNGAYYEYHISLRSWFWLLTKRINSQIFQEKNTQEIIKETTQGSPIKRYANINWDYFGKGKAKADPHPSLRYCVQHGESDFAFISRLLEDEGTYYWFESHDTKATGQMHLADNSADVSKDLPSVDNLCFTKDGQGDGRFNEISRWISSDKFETGHYIGADFNPKKPSSKLHRKISGPEEYELSGLEMFEYSAGYFTPEASETTLRMRADELASRRKRHWIVTGWPDVAAGRKLKVTGDPLNERNGNYLIAGCTFVMSHHGYPDTHPITSSISILKRLHDALNDDAMTAHTLDAIEDIVASTPSLQTGTRGSSSFLLTVLKDDAHEIFRPVRITPKVVMDGPQSAIVVGPAGEEIHVDEHGRVKVQFHWDRYGKNDENSTAWVRVSQPMAGKGWGGYFTPRIGQEVIVDFLNGDPDRPVIVGRLYNGDNKIPYQSGTQSGFKTRSTPHGNASNYNEIMFEDKKGNENINIHAERNMSRSVEVDDASSIGNDQSDKVTRDRNSSVGRNETTHVGITQSNNVGTSQINTIGAGGQINKIKGSQNNNIAHDQITIVDANQATTVKANQQTLVDGNQKIIVKGNIEQKATRMLFEAGHIDFKVTSGNSLNISADAAPYTASVKKYTLLSNTDMDLMSVGNISQTSLGSSTTVLGSNSGGYIGTSSQANMGMASATFLGLSLESALGLSVSNFLGMQIENTVALKLESIAAVGISRSSGDVRQAGIFSLSPGAGGGGGGAAATSINKIGAGVSLAGVAVGVLFAALDVNETLKQYEDAAVALDAAAEDPSTSDIPGLSARLKRMANLARTRRSEGKAIAATSVAVVLGGPVAVGVGGPVAFGMGIDATNQVDLLEPNADGSVNSNSTEDPKPPR
jgi:type VI secretion system secreted protein VgrG